MRWSWMSFFWAVMEWVCRDGAGQGALVANRARGANFAPAAPGLLPGAGTGEAAAALSRENAALSMQHQQNTPAAPAAAPLAAGDNVLATLQVDLDEDLHFSTGQLVLSERALLARLGPAGGWQR